jgi:hypothetical protein
MTTAVWARILENHAASGALFGEAMPHRATFREGGCRYWVLSREGDAARSTLAAEAMPLPGPAYPVEKSLATSSW